MGVDDFVEEPRPGESDTQRVARELDDLHDRDQQPEIAASQPPQFTPGMEVTHLSGHSGLVELGWQVTECGTDGFVTIARIETPGSGEPIRREITVAREPLAKMQPRFSTGRVIELPLGGHHKETYRVEGQTPEGWLTLRRPNGGLRRETAATVFRLKEELKLERQGDQ